MKLTKYMMMAGLSLLAVACAKLPNAQDVELTDYEDSISYAMGVVNGSGLEQMLAKDSTGKAMEAFLKALEEGLNTKSDSSLMEVKQAGMQIGGSLKQMSTQGFMGDSTLTMNFNAFMRGAEEGINGYDDIFNKETASQYLNNFQAEAQKKAMEKQEAELSKQYAKEKKANEDFLVENAKREGVKTTASGLQYEVIKEGTGAKPAATDKVKVHYEGKLINDSVFDSSYRRNEPIEFALNAVIPGWTEGVQLMSVGSKYKLYIPYKLGYGAAGAGGAIPPFATLVFTVELLDITAPETLQQQM